MHPSPDDVQSRPRTVPVPLADGGTVHLRPLRPGETDVLETVFAGLSSRSRRQRYLVPTPRLTGSARRVLADVDGRRHLAWAALVDGRPVGLCRCITIAPATAEVAFEVVDAEQGRGIGAALVDAVATVACARGTRWLEAVVDTDNHASLVLLGRLGLRLRADAGLLEGRGELRLLDPPRVDRRAALRLDAMAAPATDDGVVPGQRTG